MKSIEKLFFNLHIIMGHTRKWQKSDTFVLVSRIPTCKFHPSEASFKSTSQSDNKNLIMSWNHRLTQVGMYAHTSSNQSFNFVATLLIKRTYIDHWKTHLFSWKWQQHRHKESTKAGSIKLSFCCFFKGKKQITYSVDS